MIIIISVVEFSFEFFIVFNTKLYYLNHPKVAEKLAVAILLKLHCEFVDAVVFKINSEIIVAIKTDSLHGSQ